MTPQPGAPRRGPAKEAIDAGRTALDAMATSLYRTTAVCLGGEESEWAYSAKWSVRLLRTALLLCVLVLVATYTANLAAFFTEDSTVVYGPKSFAELNEATGCYNGVYSPGGIYLKELIYPPMYPKHGEDKKTLLFPWNNTFERAGRRGCGEMHGR